MQGLAIISFGLRSGQKRYFFFAGLVIAVLLFNQPLRLNAQTDTVPETSAKKPHSAKKATIMSAILPGLGQAYNKKYWKIPIIYAGFGTLYYFIRTNGQEYRKFRDAYNIVANNDTLLFPSNEYVVRYDANLDQLREGRNYYRRNLELSYIFTGLLYILNIIDASVDGNLYDFDVSDDLSLRLEPVNDRVMFARRPAPAITFRYRF